MKTTKIIGLVLLLTGLFSGSASAQLLITNQGLTAVPAAVRSNGADITTLLSTGLTNFNLNALASAGTFTEISPFADEFRVGFNGTFNVFMEISYITREAVDTDNLGTSFGFADGLYNPLDPTNQTLFSNYGAIPTSTLRISGTNTLTDIATLWHTDTSTGNSADQTNPMFFQFFLATSDPLYNYYVIRIDDRGSDPSTKDFNDGVFLARVNTQAVSFQPVPEPSTYALIGAAMLCGMVAVRRFRTKNAA